MLYFEQGKSVNTLLKKMLSERTYDYWVDAENPRVHLIFENENEKRLEESMDLCEIIFR